MGATLFRYLFRDLLRIFVLAAVGLAGIMSFGGLLRPLTQHGLDAVQVAQMWLYLMPAMMTYSLPVAAVFSASIVYGRLAADNELTACRAAGIGYHSICAPALALGIVATLANLLFLGYVVPFFSYQVQNVIYANAAKVVASEIQRSHSLSLPGRGSPTIFAQQAHIPEQVGKDGEQTVVLEQPMIISYPRDSAVPKMFSMAREATLFIKQGENNEVFVSGVLEGAAQFTRELGGRPQVGIGKLPFGPISMPSRLQQNVKFMDIARLKKLAANPERASRVQKSLKFFHEKQQRDLLYTDVVSAMRSRKGAVLQSLTPGEGYSITATGAKAAGDGADIVISAPAYDPIRVTLQRSGRTRVYETNTMRLSADIDNAYQQVTLSMVMYDPLMRSGEDIHQRSMTREICTMAMPQNLLQVRQRKVSDYLTAGGEMKSLYQRQLARDTIVSRNEATSEMHARASFAISCLILVLVGAMLGMQFRSGDFLTAFAVSFIPALLTITLVVAGSQTAVQVSTKALNDPLATALLLIWLGNAIAAVLAAVLFLRIRRT